MIIKVSQTLTASSAVAISMFLSQRQSAWMIPTPRPTKTAQPRRGQRDRSPDDLTASQAIEANCWPEPEFPDATAQRIGLIGNLHLTQKEEKALVRHMKTFTDRNRVRRP